MDNGKEVFEKTKQIIKEIAKKKCLDNLLENILDLQIKYSFQKDYIEFLKNQFNYEMIKIAETVCLKANFLNILDENELKELAEYMRMFKKARLTLNGLINSFDKFKIDPDTKKFQIEIEVSQIIKDYLEKNSEHFLEKANNNIKHYLYELTEVNINDLIKTKNKTNPDFNSKNDLEKNGKNFSLYSKLYAYSEPHDHVYNFEPLKLEDYIQELNLNNESKKNILLTGSSNDEAKILLFKILFNLDFNPYKNEYDTNDFIIKDLCYLNKITPFTQDQFKMDCLRIKNNLEYVICLEHLTNDLKPKPEALLFDLDKLLQVFDLNFLKKKLIFIFVTNDERMNLERLRTIAQYSDDFNVIGDYLNLLDYDNFLINRVWVFNIKTPKLDDFKNSFDFLKSFLIKDKNNSSSNIKNILLIGPMGYGKSTTGNELSKGNYFTTGNDMQRVTTTVKFQKANAQLTIVDCPGFGDPTDESVFYVEFLKKKEKFLEIVPIDAFILIIKFDQNISAAFLDAAKQFISIFGSEGIKTLMILCIQANEKRKFSHEDFKEILLNSDGYKYIKERNQDNDIPYCLWDNFKPYNGQEDSFDECIKQLKPFVELQLKYAVDSIGKELILLKESKLKKISENIQDSENTIKNTNVNIANLNSSLRPNIGFGLGNSFFNNQINQQLQLNNEKLQNEKNNLNLLIQNQNQLMEEMKSIPYLLKWN